jgi:hypothetical protein
MLKKALLAGIALAISTAAFAANVPNQTFWDPTNALGSINSVIQSFNAGVTGNLAALPAPAATTLTTIQPLFTVTVPANVLAIGNTLHVKAIGVNSADSNVKTVTFAFGNISCAQIVTGSSAVWSADFWVTITGAATESSFCTAQQGTASIAGVSATNGAVAINAAVTVLVQGTAATAGTTTLNQSWTEVLR